MQDHRIDEDPCLGDVSPEDRDKCVLDLMLVGSSWPWTVEEIARELGTQTGAQDAVNRLTAAGLLHRVGPVRLSDPHGAARHPDRRGNGLR